MDYHITIDTQNINSNAKECITFQLAHCSEEARVTDYFLKHYSIHSRHASQSCVSNDSWRKAEIFVNNFNAVRVLLIRSILEYSNHSLRNFSFFILQVWALKSFPKLLFILSKVVSFIRSFHMKYILTSAKKLLELDVSENSHLLSFIKNSPRKKVFILLKILFSLFVGAEVNSKLK